MTVKFSKYLIHDFLLWGREDSNLQSQRERIYSPRGFQLPVTPPVKIKLNALLDSIPYRLIKHGTFIRILSNLKLQLMLLIYDFIFQLYS